MNSVIAFRIQNFCGWIINYSILLFTACFVLHLLISQLSYLNGTFREANKV